MYVKLFTSIYQGTLRGNSHGLLVFTNILAHCDKAGIADIHPRAIAEEVGLTVEQVRTAIDELEAPDPESRSPEEDGRRLIRTDEHRAWGWLVVNYAKYRAIRNEDDRREQNREAQARWRNKHSKPASAKVSRDQPLSAQAEGEAEGEGRESATALSGRAPEVSNYGRICGIIRAAGIQDAAPGHMKFRSLVDAGAIAEEFLAHIPRCLAEGKRFAYLLGAVAGERERVAENGGKLHSGPMPAGPITAPPPVSAGRVADSLRAEAEAFKHRTPEQITAAKAIKDAALAAVRRA